jgi:hypothetical protein
MAFRSTSKAHNLKIRDRTSDRLHHHHAKGDALDLGKPLISLTWDDRDSDHRHSLGLSE